MTSKPTVTATLAGDEADLTRAFDKVGSAAKEMDAKVDSASKGMRQSSKEGFDRVGEGFDELDTKAMGFRDSLTGVQDTSMGLSEIMKGDLFTGFLTLGAGLGDLGSAFYNLIIPALSTFWTTLTTTVIPAVWSFTAALFANPITWIVIGIAALIGVLYLLGVRFDDVKNVVGAVVGWIADRWTGLMNWFGGVPDWFGRIFGAIGNAISGAFKGVINWIVDRLNWLIDLANKVIYGINVVNPFSDIPSIPHIPRMHTGGVVQGRPGQEVPVLAMAGERLDSNVGPSIQSGLGVRFSGNTDSAFASAFQHLVNIGEITLVTS